MKVFDTNNGVRNIKIEELKIEPQYFEAQKLGKKILKFAKTIGIIKLVKY